MIIMSCDFTVTRRSQNHFLSTLMNSEQLVFCTLEFKGFVKIHTETYSLVILHYFELVPAVHFSSHSFLHIYM